MTRAEQDRCWEVMTKQIEALRVEVHAAYEVWDRGAKSLHKLERERNELWRQWANEAVNT